MANNNTLDRRAVALASEYTKIGPLEQVRRRINNSAFSELAALTNQQQNNASFNRNARSALSGLAWTQDETEEEDDETQDDPETPVIPEANDQGPTQKMTTNLNSCWDTLFHDYV